MYSKITYNYEKINKVKLTNKSQQYSKKTRIEKEKKERVKNIIIRQK